MGAPAVKPTLRQERLAEALLDPTTKTKADALLKAGYSPVSARANPGRQIALAGTQNALAARQARQRDKARGLHALAERALADPTLIDALEPRDRLAFGLSAMKTAAELGVEPDPGDRERFKAWKRRRLVRCRSMFVRMYVSGVGPLGWRVPQDVVLSPDVIEASTEKG